MFKTGRARARYLCTEILPGPTDAVFIEDPYFGSYSKTSIHRTMIKDNTRTSSYRNAIFHNKHLFEGKTVLDVGCGTGILSLFAAKAGAKKVIGVDNSNIAHLARKVVVDNNLQDTILILKGKVEEVELPVKEVDVIISEWMGFCLFYESMLDSVLFARDKWLTAGGLIFPDIVKLYLLGISDNHDKHRDLQHYGQQYQIDLSALKDLARKDILVAAVDPSKVVTDKFRLKTFNLQTDSKKDIKVDINFSLNMKKASVLNVLVIFFDVIFSHCHKEVNKYVLLTSQIKTFLFLGEVLYSPRQPDTLAADLGQSGERLLPQGGRGSPRCLPDGKKFAKWQGAGVPDWCHH